MNEYIDQQLSKVKNCGFIEEGYETIYSYETWLSIEQSCLRDFIVSSRYVGKLNIMNQGTLIEDMYEFVNICKDNNITRLTFDYDIDNDDDPRLTSAELFAYNEIRNKATAEEMFSRYSVYVKQMNRTNRAKWNMYFKSKNNPEYIKYMELKKKFSGL